MPQLQKVKKELIPIRSELTLNSFEGKINSMLDFAICEISGKQYKIVPNQPFEVDFLGDTSKKIEAQVLLLSEDNKISMGTPYLKDKITLDCLDSVKADKIRVAKFHPKANFRRVTGHRAKKTRVVLSVKKT